jgi:hypothetical protein
MQMMKRLLQIGLVTLALAGSARAAEVGWNFGTGSVGTLSPTSGVPVPNLTVSDFSRANGGPNDSQANIIDSNSNSTGAYAGASGDNNAQAIAIAAPLDITNSTYFSFTLTPTGGNIVTLTGFTFGSRSSTGGPTLVSIRSSLDNYATNIASANVLADMNWALLTPLTLSTSSGLDSPITFRIYGTDGGNGNAVNWRLDDFQVTVNVAAVPEPSTWGMLFFGAASLVAARRFSSLRR